MDVTRGGERETALSSSLVSDGTSGDEGLKLSGESGGVSGSGMGGGNSVVGPAGRAGVGTGSGMDLVLLSSLEQWGKTVSKEVAVVAT